MCCVLSKSTKLQRGVTHSHISIKMLFINLTEYCKSMKDFFFNYNTKRHLQQEGSSIYYYSKVHPQPVPLT